MSTPRPGETDLPTESRQPSDKVLIERIEREKRDRERLKKEPVGSLWRTVAQVGILGWLIALPPVLGAFFGHLLDMRLGSGVTWALGLLFLGLAVGAYFFWRAIQEAEGKGP